MNGAPALAVFGLAILGALLGAGEGVDPKLLPTEAEGGGLADRFPGDKGIARDRRVVLAEDFEKEDFAKAWSDVKRVKPETAEAEVHAGKRSVRMEFLAGRTTGGHLYRMLDPGHEKLHFRFYVKFPKDHGYVHHFVHLTGYNPPTRWPQGCAGIRPDGAKRFSTGLDIFGDWGRTKPPGRWGFYSYWCEMKGSRDGNFWGNEPKDGKRIPVARGKWICAEFMVKLNEVGEADGEQAFWIDGKCAGRWGGYRWRTDEKLKINGVWLLYYVTGDAIKRSRGEPKDQHVLFDDVVVATEYIGPMKKRER